MHEHGTDLAVDKEALAKHIVWLGQTVAQSVPKKSASAFILAPLSVAILPMSIPAALLLATVCLSWGAFVRPVFFDVNSPQALRNRIIRRLAIKRFGMTGWLIGHSRKIIGAIDTHDHELAIETKNAIYALEKELMQSPALTDKIMNAATSGDPKKTRFANSVALLGIIDAIAKSPHGIVWPTSPLGHVAKQLVHARHTPFLGVLGDIIETISNLNQPIRSENNVETQKSGSGH